MIICANLLLLSLSNSPTDLSIWVWLALAMALIAMFGSLTALRRTKQNQQSQVIETSAAAPYSPIADALDPAIIAVLTAAVTMMLSETTSDSNSSRPSSDTKSPAGFIIRTIRRV